MDIISVFIQNRPGRLLQIIREIEGITLYGFSIADAGDFGIVRLCVDRPAEAMRSLRSKEFIAHLTPGPAVEAAHLERAVELFEREDINIDDAIYAVLVGDKRLVALRVSDPEKAVAALEKEGIPSF
ncbi:MAG: hypothetical protein KO463_07350 [Candidatus Methanofastidiosa archaeon]|jgi:hypothetical protein|nr:hypothetical protein [Candidatus Methanofastidiosa archaeon]